MRTDSRSDRDITTVEDGSPTVERVGLQRNIVATAEKSQDKSRTFGPMGVSLEIQSPGSLTDAGRSKAGARPVGGAGVEWSTWGRSV